MHFITGMLLSLLVVLFASTSVAAPPLSSEERVALYEVLQRQVEVLQQQAAVVKTVAKLVGPTVVHIEANVAPQVASSSRGKKRHIEEAGSGVIVELQNKFYVLTNRHVIRNATSEHINIRLANGRQLHPAKILMDPETDVAVLGVSGPELVASPLGDSNKLEVGDFVLAVGSPFGLSHSVTYGIISSKGRRNLQLGASEVKFQNFLQTDAAINPGNSGGPLISLRGEVIGINTAIASNSGGNEGIGFAIPINMFMAIANQLVEHGHVTRAFLGVKLDAHFGYAMAIEVGLPRPMGTRITWITPESPAEAADLRINDVILKYDGISVEDDSHLVNLVGITKIRKIVTLEVFRDYQRMTIPIEVTNRDGFDVSR